MKTFALLAAVVLALAASTAPFTKSASAGPCDGTSSCVLPPGPCSGTDCVLPPGPCDGSSGC